MNKNDPLSLVHSVESKNITWIKLKNDREIDPLILRNAVIIYRNTHGISPQKFETRKWILNFKNKMGFSETKKLPTISSRSSREIAKKLKISRSDLYQYVFYHQYFKQKYCVKFDKILWINKAGQQILRKWRREIKTIAKHI